MKTNKFHFFKISVVFFATVCAAFANTAIQPAPRNEKWMGRHKAFIEEAKKGNIDVLFIGDSITDNWRNPDQGKPVWDEHFAPLNAANFGISGDRTQNVLWRLRNGEAEGYSPKAIVLLIGTNNTGWEKNKVTPRNSPDEVVQGITAVVTEIRALFPSAKILLLGIFPRGDKDAPQQKDFVPQREQIQEINSEISKLNDGKKIFYLDFGSKFLDASGNLRKDLMPDLLHLNHAGYKIWAEEIKQPLIRLLSGVESLATEKSTAVIVNVSELEGAIRNASPGDIILMANGIWHDVRIRFKGQGTLQHPITLRAQTPGKVILSGTSSLAIGGEYLVVDGLFFQNSYTDSGHLIAFRTDSQSDARHCRLTNTAIVNSALSKNQGNAGKWVSLYGKNNRVDHCYFRGKNTSGSILTVWLDGEPNNHQIDNNYFGERPLLGENGGDVIRIGDSQSSMQNSRTMVESNYFENCDGEVEIISNKSCENIYRHNTFFRNAGTLTLRHGNRCLVEGNYFIGGGKANSGGVRIVGEGHRVLNNYFADLTGEKFYSAIGFMACIKNSTLSGYFQIKNAVVAFNTVVRCQNSLFFGIGFGSSNRTLPPEDSIIANNIVYSESAPLVTELVTPIRMTWEGNIFYGTKTGQPENSGIKVVNPLLVKGTDGLWYPGANSPAVGAAVGSFPGVTSDILGHQRGSRKDTGCLQISAATPIRFAPLTADDVGPEWMKN